ncbi:MAG: hypothetical protein QM762_26260 [Chryseolinea sp.]
MDQLDRILSNALFSNSPALCNFLRFTVEETLNGDSSVLKQYTIAVTALGRRPDFNPQLDAIVRIQATRLRKMLNDYYAGPGVQDPIVIELIKGSYIPIFRPSQWQLGTVVPTDRPTSIAFQSKVTIGVLPFRNLCPDESFQFFADGLGEELTRLFSMSQDISVVAHYSARKYSMTTFDIKAIGMELGTHYLITGSVWRTSKEIRISVGLAETEKGTEVWSKRYAYSIQDGDIIDIQDRIIEDIASILGGYYGIIIKNAYTSGRCNPVSIELFDAALWNYYFHMNFSRDVYMTTRTALETALQQDPKFATGMAMLAEIYLDAYSLGFPTPPDAVRTGFELAKAAIGIDPLCQHAYQSYAWANLYMKNKTESLLAMEKCLAINPSSVSTMGTIGFGMACAGEYETAVELLNNSISLNPHCPWWFYLGYFLVYYSQSDYNKALWAAEKISPEDVFFNPLTKIAAKGRLQMIDDAVEDCYRMTSAFADVTRELEVYLKSFLFDEELIVKILEGARIAGLPV